MAVEIPTDAIKQLQISLRKEAKMSSYDPDDTPLANLPSPEETISEVDPSPPYLRCKHCKGRLLRGVASLICIFCGRETCEDLPPDPINFRNTFGYQWLLRSLALNGSEIVDLPTVANESIRGQTATKDELTLSELLNVEIRWTSKSEKSGTGLSDEKTPTRPKSFLDLTGVNLDNFFSEGEKDAALRASEEPFESSMQIATTESSAFQGRENLSLFASEEPFELSKQSSTTESSAFQGRENLSLFASKKPFESSKQSSTTESSAFQGRENLSLFASEKPFESSKQIATTESSAFQGRENLSLFASEEPFESSKQIATTETSAVQGRENLSLFASEKPFELSKQVVTTESNAFQGHENLSLFENVQPSEIAVQSTQGEIGDSISSWPASFQSAASENLSQESKSLDPFVGSTVDLSTHIDTVFGSVGDSTNEKLNQSTNDDWFPDVLLSISNSRLAAQPEQFEALATVKDDRIAENANNSYSTGVDWVQDTQWQTTSNEAPDNKIADKDDDPFGAWNDFTISSSAQNPSSSSKQTVDQMTPADETSVTNLFSTTSNSQDLDFGSFLQPDLSAGAFSSSHGSTVVNMTQPEASALDRMADLGTKDEDVAKHGGDVSSSRAESKSEDVEKIMSQMHDLSFMLESNLSIPPKQDGLHSHSQDYT